MCFFIKVRHMGCHLAGGLPKSPWALLLSLNQGQHHRKHSLCANVHCSAYLLLLTKLPPKLGGFTQPLILFPIPWVRNLGRSLLGNLSRIYMAGPRASGARRPTVTCLAPPCSWAPVSTRLGFSQRGGLRVDILLRWQLASKNKGSKRQKWKLRG